MAEILRWEDECDQEGAENDEERFDHMAMHVEGRILPSPQVVKGVAQ